MAHQPSPIDWDALIAEVTARGAAVPEVHWCTPGEAAGLAALSGPEGFLSPGRLGLYATKRNDPSVAPALSNLSPWLHFGQLAPQRAALEAAKLKAKHKESVEGFLEVRRLQACLDAHLQHMLIGAREFNVLNDPTTACKDARVLAACIASHGWHLCATRVHLRSVPDEPMNRVASKLCPPFLTPPPLRTVPLRSWWCAAS